MMPGTKRVSGQSRLSLFRCHEQTNQERERKRDAENYQTQLISIRKKGMVRMHEKCMNM